MTPLQRWRTDRGWTTKQAAHHLGIAEAEYLKYEPVRTMTLRTVPIDRLPSYPA